MNLNNLNKKYLFSSDLLESHFNYLCYKNYKKSFNKEQVIVGENDFLFLGNGYARVLDKTQGKFPYTNEEINKWTYELKKVQNWYENRNINFILVIAPNKHSIYFDKLPGDTPYKINGTITDDIIKYSIKKNINILDLRNILIQKKPEDQLYFTTDTHWNNKGAAIGFENTMAYINSNFEKNHKTPEYTLSSSFRSGGDLANFLKIKSFLTNNYEKNFNFNFQQNDKICLGNINKDQILGKCSLRDNQNMDIVLQDKYMINNDALNKGKLLLIGDSFATANSQLYNATFSTIWKFHYNRLNGAKIASFVKEHNPNIVIYQVVERDLYNQEIINEL